MSDSLQEVQALPGGLARQVEEPDHLSGTAHTPKVQPPEASQTTHASAAGSRPEGNHESGGEAGGTKPRGPIVPYSAAEIAQRAAASQPGAVLFERQFGAQSVGVSVTPVEQREKPEHPRQGSMGDLRAGLTGKQPENGDAPTS